MTEEDYCKEFIEDVKASAQETGEGTTACFVSKVADQLIEADIIEDFCPSFYTGRYKNRITRVDGYWYNDFDNTMYLAIADIDVNDLSRHITATTSKQLFNRQLAFLDQVRLSNLYEEIEISSPVSDLIELLRAPEKPIQRINLMIFTNATISNTLKTVSIPDYNNLPVEGQIWNLQRLFKFCFSNQEAEIEIDFKNYTDEGIPCLEASSAKSSKYVSYLGVIPGKTLADLYEKYGSRLLEGNVRSFLSTKVAVNKQIRSTINNAPEMFFAYNNGISCTAKDVRIEDTPHGRFITYAKDFQIINGGQTTASIANAKLKDKADLSKIFVQMKLTAIDESSDEEADTLIRNISRSSNSQNKVSDADFFASHPFHRQMESASRRTFAPAVKGAQYETKWFYERARGQYVQAQMYLTPAQKRQFQMVQPKKHVITKIELAKVQNTWRGYPYIVSKGAQTNFISFAKYINDEWEKNSGLFTTRYYQDTVSLEIMFQYLTDYITHATWYEGGYRANIVYYTISLFHEKIKEQFPGSDLDLHYIWDIQDVPDEIKGVLNDLSFKVFQSITSDNRPIINVTQWCKKEHCWNEVEKILYTIPENLSKYLIRTDVVEQNKKDEKKRTRNIDAGINAQVEIMKYNGDQWKQIAKYALENHLAKQTDFTALTVATEIPKKIPSDTQSRKLYRLLQTCKDDGLDIEPDKNQTSAS